MRKAFLVLAAVAMMALCLPGTVMAQNFDDFTITARVGAPMSLSLATDEIAFGSYPPSAHADILALNDIIVTVGGDADAPYEVFFDGNITAAATDYAVTMEEVGGDFFTVNIRHDSGLALVAGADTFNITGVIPGNALLGKTPGAYAPAVNVEIRVDYQ